MHVVANALPTLVTHSRLRNQQVFEFRKPFGDNLDAGVSNIIASYVKALDEMEVVDDDFAGEAGEEVVSGFKLFEVGEACDGRHLFDEILISKIFIIELCGATKVVDFDVIPSVGIGIAGCAFGVEDFRYGFFAFKGL